jgi:hypothetical protein
MRSIGARRPDPPVRSWTQTLREQRRARANGLLGLEEIWQAVRIGDLALLVPVFLRVAGRENVHLRMFFHEMRWIG